MTTEQALALAEAIERIELLAYGEGLIRIEIAADHWLGVGIDVIDDGAWEEDESLASALIRLAQKIKDAQ